MFNKIYEGIKNFIKNNIGFVITLIVMVILVTVKLPYEVEMPGGIIDLSDRITVDGKDADIVLLDEENNIADVFVGGKYIER